MKHLIATVFNSEKARLFVHVDKTVYLPNETIWFTAYRLGDQQLSGNTDVLCVALVKNDVHSIAIQKKFPLNGLTSSGNIVIPDSLATGDYSVIAYTNHLTKGIPDELFTQRIAIKRISDPALKIPGPDDRKRADSAPINIKFYPEGGNLVADLPGYVGWEARDGTGAPLKLKAVLLKDGEFIDTVETSEYGMGKFFIRPKPGSRYMLKLAGNIIQVLPAMVAKGVSITLPAAWVKDSLMFKLNSTLPGKIHIVIHNARHIFYALMNVEAKTGKLYKIALDSLPRGLAVVTLFDENFQPCAERLFFAHADLPQILGMTTNAKKYGKRQKVALKISLNSNLASQALLSVACVQGVRVSRRDLNEITNYGYINHDLDSLPDVNYREDVLLIRGWSKYTSAATGIEDTISSLRGTVTIGQKPAKTAVPLTLMGNGKVFFVTADSLGNFSIDYDKLVVPDGKTVALFATGDNAYTTHIHIKDPFAPVSQWLAAQTTVIKRTGEPQLPVTQNQVLLKEVKIKASKTTQFYNTAATPGLHTNACGDYVCITNALNCPFPGHTYRTSIPVKGHRYMRHVVVGGQIVQNDFFIYEGCETKNQSLIRFDGLNQNKEFYTYNDADVTTADPLYNSTLLWKDQVNLKTGDAADLSFYTGDISGRFIVIVQGITDHGVVCNEDHFEITK